MSNRMCFRIPSLLFVLGSAFALMAADNPFVGDWAFTTPGGGAGWLGVRQTGSQLQANMLWEGGSVFPLDGARMEGQRLVLTRKHNSERRDAQGKKQKTTLTETITCTTQGDTIHFSSVKQRGSGRGEDKAEFSGKRQPAMPPAPNLASVKFGDAIVLFNGKDLSGWRLTNPNAVNGWSVKDGILVNNPMQEEGKPHKNYGNLRTEREFEDFELKVEVRVSKNQNSGIYLRGIYEVQVADTYGRPLDSHNMGAVYSRIKPTASAEKPAGEWQTLDLTLVDRHVTVVLNGQKIIDNQPVEGCTGGALWSDIGRPGPIYLQGDHTGVEYRSLVLRPVAR